MRQQLAVHRRRPALKPRRCPPATLARELAERLFPRGLAAQLAHAATQVNASPCLRRIEDGLMFGLRGPAQIGLYLQPNRDGDGSWGYRPAPMSRRWTPGGAVSGPFEGAAAGSLRTAGDAAQPRAERDGRREMAWGQGAEGKSVFGTESQPSKDLLFVAGDRRAERLANPDPAAAQRSRLCRLCRRR